MFMWQQWICCEGFWLRGILKFVLKVEMYTIFFPSWLSYHKYAHNISIFHWIEPQKGHWLIGAVLTLFHCMWFYLKAQIVAMLITFPHFGSQPLTDCCILQCTLCDCQVYSYLSLKKQTTKKTHYAQLLMDRFLADLDFLKGLTLFWYL